MIRTGSRERNKTKKQESKKAQTLRSWKPKLETLEDRLTPAGNWNPLTNLFPGVSDGTMLLLSDGSIMINEEGPLANNAVNIASANWFKLTPQPGTGSYVNGTFTQIASMATARRFFGSVVLPDGRVMVAGGEYSGPQSLQNDTNTAEIYNPVTNIWTPIASVPTPDGKFGDGTLELLSDGSVLAGWLDGSQTERYNVATNTWTTGPSLLNGDTSSEESWVKLPNGQLLTYSISGSQPQRGQLFVPGATQAQDAWVDAGAVPVRLDSNGGAGIVPENGGAVRLPDGRVFYLGASGNTAFYTPATNSWAAGPVIPNNLGAFDAPVAIMPNGHVLLAAGVINGTTFPPPAQLDEWDPTTNTITQLPTPAGLTAQLTNTQVFESRLLVLPNGDVLMDTGDQTKQFWEFTPTSPGLQNSWRPVINSIADNHDGTFTLRGTQLTGLSEGSNYGDDAQNATNYPIIQVVGAFGTAYARTFGWDNNNIATGSTPESVQFTLPAGVSLSQVGAFFAIANGISSAAANDLILSPNGLENVVFRVDPNNAGLIDVMNAAYVTQFVISNNALGTFNVFGDVNPNSVTIDNSFGNVNTPIAFDGGGSNAFPNDREIIIGSNGDDFLNVNNTSQTSANTQFNFAALMSFTNIQQLIFNGQGGNDNMNIVSTNSLLSLLNGIQYDGGTGSNTLALAGGTTTQTSDTYSVGPNPGQGSDVIEGPGGIQSVFFQNLAPVFDFVPATTAIVNGTNADNAINYTGFSVDGIVTIDNQESYEFNSKANLVINGLAGSDTINLNNPTVPFGLTGTITVNGGDPTGSDTLIANSEGRNLVLEPTGQGAGIVTYFGGGLPNTPFTNIEHLTLVDTATNPFGIDGTTGGDQFIYTPGATPDTGTVNGTMNSGAAQFPLVPITFVGMQQAGVVVFNTFGQQGGQDSFVFNGTAANDNISVTNGGVFGGITLSDVVNASLFANLNLNNMVAAVVQGNDGDDTFTHDGSIPISVIYDGGNPSGSDTLNFTANAGAATNVDLTAGTINSTGSGLVTFSGVEHVNETSNGVGSTLTIHGTNGQETFVLSPTLATFGTGTVSGFGTSLSFTGVRGTITFNGNDPANGDIVTENGIPGVLDNLRYLPTNVGAGTVTNDSEPVPNVVFTGAAHLNLVVQQADGDGVRVDGTTGNDAFEYFQGVTSDSGTMVGTMDQNNTTGHGPFTMTPMTYFGASPIANDFDVNFFNPGGTDTLAYNGTANDDNITVQGGEAGGTEFRNTLNGIIASRLEVFNISSALVRGLAGNDNITVNQIAGPAIVALRIEGGDSDQFTDTLNFNASAGAATNVNLGTATITQTGPVGNTVVYNGIERINLTSVGAGSTLALTGTAGDDAFNFVPSAVGAGSFTASASGSAAYTSPLFTYTGVGAGITVNGGAGVDTLGLTATPGNDNINAVQSTATALAYTQNAFTQNFTVNAMEAAGINAGDGDDVIRVSVADALEAAPAGSLHFLVNGGSGNDRLIVNDDGVGDLTILRQIDGQSGNATVGALNPITYSGTERVDVTPVNNLTGGTGTDGNGRVVVFHSDPFEYNDTRLVAGQLNRVTQFPTSPSIDSAAITNPFAVGGDEDWYQFLPTQTGTFDISIIYRAIGTLANGRAGLPSSGNLTLDIFDATGNLITSGVATIDQSGETHLSAVFGATNDPSSVFHVIFVRVRGATPDSVNVYDFDHLGTGASLQVDNEGPQVTNVQITGFPDYNLFGLKPVDALQGPTPLVNSLTISFQDLPPRAPGFVYPALDFQTASTPGQYVLRGDRVGIIAIQNIIVTNNPPAVGQVPTATVELDFAQPLPDDHYTLTVSDHIRDPAGNKLDGESNAAEPNEGPTFPSGDGHPGGNFIAAFVVDSRPEFGFYANGSVHIDINGDFIDNPNVLPEGDTVLPYGPNGAAVFSGQFSDVGAFAVNGFDRLGTYGREAGHFVFRLDFNDDGDFSDPGEVIPSALQINGMPIAGMWGPKAGDSVGLFTGTTWYLDTNGNNMIDAGDTVLHGNMRGLPITGDFDGDGLTDLATYQNGNFYFDLAANDPGGQLTGNTNVSFRVSGFPGGPNGVASRLARPIAGDFNRDGITDVGLFIPNQTNLTRYQANWFVLVSNEALFGPRITGTVNELNHPFHSNQLPGGSLDFSATYGSSRALPIVGNFDPPAAVIAARNHGATTSAAHLASLVQAHDLTDLYFATDIDPFTGRPRHHHN